jgi:WD40 repeat protein
MLLGNNSVCTECGDEMAVTRNSMNCTIIKHIRAHVGYIRHVKYNATGQLLATAAHDGKVYIWDTRARSLVNQLMHIDVGQGAYTHSRDVGTVDMLAHQER